MATEQIPTFGELLRRYREAAGLSQEDLAERARISPNAIGALERGERRKPYPRTVQLLADALGLDKESRSGLIAAVPRRNADPAAHFPEVGSIASGVLPDPDDAQLQSAGGRDTAGAVPTYSGTRRGTTSFVGRQGEMTVLLDKLESAFAGQGTIVVLAGEAGIGKTCLAREFADQAASHGAMVLWGSCFEGDWQPPYGPWVEAFGAYVRSRPREDVRRELGTSASPMAQLVPEVRAALPEVPLPSPLSPDEERFRLYDATIRFILAVARRQPVLLVLDDLHWADPDSLRLLRHLSRFVEQARVLVVGAYRDPEFGLDDQHPLMGTLSVLRREVDYERIPVRGFGCDEMADYLAHAAGQRLPQALASKIEDETSGNPFYAREICRHLMEETKVPRNGGQWTTGLDMRELGIPEGVRQVVGRRVSRLSGQTGALLRLAAGFTAGFGFDVLQALSGLPEQSLLDCIDEALQAGLIRISGQSPPRYEFAHAIVRHTLYDGLNLDRRTRLHRQIALALEQVRSGGEAEDAEMAAQYHASAALPGAAKGIPPALRAAERARAVYSHERAAVFLRMARDLSGESPAQEKAKILRQLAIAESEAVELEHAQRSTGDALEAMGAAGVEAEARVEFLVTVARALKDGGAVATAWEPLVERGLEFVGEARNLPWARLELLRNHFELIQSGPIGGSRWLGHDPEAVAVARAEGNEEDYARTLDPLGCRTREETEAVLSLARSWSRPVAIMWALDVAGRDLMYRHGAFHEALAVYQELLAASERFGSIPSQGEALAHMATAQIAIGGLCLAQETMRRANEVISRLGAGHRMYKFVAISRAILFAYFLEGDWERIAEDVTEYATSAAARLSSVGMVAAAVATLGLSRAGSHTAAHTLLQHCTSSLEHMPTTTYAHHLAVSGAATAVWEMETTEYAATYRRLMLDLMQAGVRYSPLGPLELWIARMSVLLGDAGEAQDYFERARNSAVAQGLTHVRGIVDYDQACSLIRSGSDDMPRIVELLDSALDAFLSHGMLGWARLAAAKKDKLTADP